MKAQFVTENMNFERGQDPKKSMDIGKSYLDREKIKSIIWSLDLDFEAIFKDPYEFIESYKGYPILVFFDFPEKWYGISNPSLEIISVGPYSSKNLALNKIKEEIDDYEISKKENVIKENLNFQKNQDPLTSLRIGRIHTVPFNVDYLEDFEGEEIGEKKKAVDWIWNGIMVKSAKGTVSTFRTIMIIELTNEDTIEFESQYYVNSPLKNCAIITIDSPDSSKNIYKKNCFDKFDKAIEDGSIILSILKIYEDIKNKEIK